MAKSLSCPFIECSAMDGVNVDIAFRELVKLVRKDEAVSHVSKGVRIALMELAHERSGAEDSGWAIPVFPDTASIISAGSSTTSP